MVELKPGWLARQARQAYNDIKTWPTWMRREAGLMAKGNQNYRKGRTFEYKTMKRWGSKDSIYKTLRSSGSHSPFDIVAWTTDLSQVQYLRPGGTRELGRDYEYKTTLTPIVGLGIQCKVRKLKEKKGGGV